MKPSTDIVESANSIGISIVIKEIELYLLFTTPVLWWQARLSVEEPPPNIHFHRNINKTI